MTSVPPTLLSRCAVAFSLCALLSCSSTERRVVYVPSTMGVSGVDPTAPPRTITLDLLVFRLENLIVLDRHPEVRLRLWACGQHFATTPAPWEAEVGWPEDRLVLDPKCSTSSNVVIGLENASNGHYLATAKMSLGDMLESSPLELEGVGGKVFLDVQSYGLPAAGEPRKVPLSVPASRALDDLLAATNGAPRETEVGGWKAIPVAQGDAVRIGVRGDVCRGNDCFGPKGRTGFFGFFQRNRLLARIGSQVEVLDRERWFVSKHTGELLLYVEGAGPALMGGYDAVVEVNPESSVPEPAVQTDPVGVGRQVAFSRAAL